MTAIVLSNPPADFESILRTIFLFVLRLIGNEEAAADICQDVAVVLLRNQVRRKSDQDKLKFGLWIARRRAYSWMRAQYRRTQDAGALALVAAAGVAPEARAEFVAVRTRIETAISAFQGAGRAGRLKAKVLRAALDEIDAGRYPTSRTLADAVYPHKRGTPGQHQRGYRLWTVFVRVLVDIFWNDAAP